MTKKYMKKPVIIEAVQYLGEDTVDQCLEFLQNKASWFPVSDEILIPTLEGDMITSNGDWIIKGIKGEFYPCKPDIFEATYEEITDDSK